MQAASGLLPHAPSRTRSAGPDTAGTARGIRPQGFMRIGRIKQMLLDLRKSCSLGWGKFTKYGGFTRDLRTKIKGPGFHLCPCFYWSGREDCLKPSWFKPCGRTRFARATKIVPDKFVKPPSELRTLSSMINKKPPEGGFFIDGRGGEIRTRDPCNPMR